MEDNIVTLLSGDGEEIRFIDIAGIAYNGHFYSILKPLDPLEGMDEDEALVFEVTRSGDTDHLEIVLDDEIIDAVFSEYEKLYDELR